MKDKTQLITSLDFAYDAIQHECYNDALSSILEAKEAAQQILDLYQPKWIDVNQRLPDAEPKRNIEIACVSPYSDDEKSPYSMHVSTRIPIKAFEGAYAWREVVLPKPPGESE